MRSAIVLGTGRASGPRSQVLPVQVREIRLVGRLIGLGSGKERELEDLYRRSARHTRAVAERIVFTDGTAHGSPPSAPTPSTSTSVSQDQSAEPAPGRSTGSARNAYRQSRRGTAASGSRSPRRAGRNRATRRRPEGPYPWS